MLMYVRMLVGVFIAVVVFSFLWALIKMCVNSLKKNFFSLCIYKFFYKLIINTFVHTLCSVVVVVENTHIQTNILTHLSAYYFEYVCNLTSSSLKPFFPLYLLLSLGVCWYSKQKKKKVY